MCTYIFLLFFRYKSECSWAPIDLSPIDADKLNLSVSPITGPSLKVVGKAAKRPSESWREIVTSVTQVNSVFGSQIFKMLMEKIKRHNEL